MSYICYGLVVLFSGRARFCVVIHVKANLMKRSLFLLSSILLASTMLASCAKNNGGAAYGGNDTMQAAANNTEANKALAKRFYEEVFNARKLDAIDQLCAADFVDHDPDPGQEPGAAGVKKSFASWMGAFPDLHVTIVQMLAEDDLVATVAKMSGTMKGDMMGMKATNKPFNSTVVDVIRVKDGKAVERWGAFDAMGMMQQLGFGPGAPPPGKKS